VGETVVGGLGRAAERGITYRPLRDADPVPVHLIRRHHDPHPATHAVVALLARLYREATCVAGAGRGWRLAGIA
jgi:hypothetical protein